MIRRLLVALLLLPLPALAQDKEDRAERADRLRKMIEDSVVPSARSKRDRTGSVAPEDKEVALRIVRQLDGRRLSVNFQETGFDEALDFVRDVTGLNVVLSKKAREKVEEEKPTVNLKLKDVKIRSVLELLLEQGHGDLRYGVRHGVLFIGTDEDWKSELTLRFIPVDDILHQPKDFPGPKVGLGDEGVTFDDD